MTVSCNIWLKRLEFSNFMRGKYLQTIELHNSHYSEFDQRRCFQDFTEAQFLAVHSLKLHSNYSLVNIEKFNNLIELHLVNCVYSFSLFNRPNILR